MIEYRKIYYELIKIAYTQINADSFIKVLINNYECFIILNNYNFKNASKIFKKDENNILQELDESEEPEAFNAYNGNLLYVSEQFNESYLNIEGSHITNIGRVSPFTNKLVRTTVPRHKFIKEGTSEGILDRLEIYFKHFWNTVENKSNKNIAINRKDKQLKDIDSEELSEDEQFEKDYKNLLMEEFKNKRLERFKKLLIDKEQLDEKKKEEKDKLLDLKQKINNEINFMPDNEFKSKLNNFLSEKFGLNFSGPYKISPINIYIVLKSQNNDKKIQLPEHSDFSSLSPDKRDIIINLIGNNIKHNFSSFKNEFIKHILLKK